MKQCELDSMSIDELFMFHERLSATLAAKITAEKETMVDQLKQAEMRLHGIGRGRCLQSRSSDP
jgi:hypothetical protein